MSETNLITEKELGQEGNTNILVINCGSSSVKYKLFGMPDKVVVAEGIVERVGEDLGKVNHVIYPGQVREERIVFEKIIIDHGKGLEIVSGLLAHEEKGVIKKRSEITAIGHRVVHGGEFFRKPTLISNKVLDRIKAVIPLAPLHNPVNIRGIEVARELFPKAPQVAVFDTAFHQTMLPYVFHYALPYEYYEKYHIRKYGFHGTSHKYVSCKASEMLGNSLDKTNLITIHLGSGCSISAVRNGKSLDTSMGMTPLSGLIMGTRSGDIDPSICLHLEKMDNLSADEIDVMLNNQSGLRGICGENDMRNIQQRRSKGDHRAQLAFEMFIYSVKKYIGAYAAVLGKLDALVFTGGIGENDPDTRRACCEYLEILGIKVDRKQNERKSNNPRSIHHKESRSAVFVIPTKEELEIATQTATLINNY